MLVAALNPIALKFGPFEIHWYGVIIATGVVLAVVLAMREADRRQVSSDDLFNLILWSLPFALIGARLYYVLFEWPYYAAHPGEIIAIWHGGMAIYGSLIAAAIVFYVFCRRHQLPVWLVLDIAAPTVILGQGIGRWGNFMNQEAFGAQTSLTFLQGLHLPNFIIQQMFINRAYRQPTFLYESVWDLLGFVVIMSLRHRKGLFKQGEVFLLYVSWYAFGRFFIEGMRTDSLMLFNLLRVSQLLSLIFFIGAIGLWIWRRYNDPLLVDYLAGNQKK
ncbi:prolipoprotein diacylglyceryl transferase [Loigolactobacillus backii]|uniref:Phosphatidylglycerol--prolipoprotein diacylglyceryl transferase n=1 Tax=Loigolactobacillus backii TaxID=375175 RepID=A0A192H3C9_9LACO|nr:prolipoprotein diacylglyceryl transferase [Loigolactobacillus backii]ANK59977.1 prolipoprotein diacylglyceryl transferase [Loigolactobacillus backii]ANK63314.1 prolipoprotein diacylglyceryl transferase [Loigolactobacillus backii]ANK64911.1 prolipoprotein diacylglyceryl transferase [Loigolactobacillus backii]ANK66641.1 prolipoprotein diacylglyceryl transferase [Loigolactobacillus backii]ANK69681.1 prolipoprotein diacylglyceryl transferase [Loigolactobacillus backii]